MENNILGGLTGLPPNIPTNYWTKKDQIAINEKFVSVTKANTQQVPAPWKTYIVNQDIMGVDLSKEGGAKVVVFKKGEKVESNRIAVDPDFKYGVEMVVPRKGIEVRNPTLSKTSGIIYSVFIPFTQLTEIASSTNEPTTPTSNELSVNNTKLLQYAVIGLVIYIVFIK